MDHGIEELLEVDPLGKAVGSDEDAALSCSEHLDALLTLCRWEHPRYGVDGNARAEGVAKVGGHVVGRRDEPAEHDHLVALVH